MRRWPGEPPCAAMSASSRRRRRSPTAKAGPASNTTSSTIMTPASPIATISVHVDRRLASRRAVQRADPRRPHGTGPAARRRSAAGLGPRDRPRGVGQPADTATVPLVEEQGAGQPDDLRAFGLVRVLDHSDDPQRPLLPRDGQRRAEAGPPSPASRGSPRSPGPRPGTRPSTRRYMPAVRGSRRSSSRAATWPRAPGSGSRRCPRSPEGAGLRVRGAPPAPPMSTVGVETGPASLDGQHWPWKSCSSLPRVSVVLIRTSAAPRSAARRSLGVRSAVAAKVRSPVMTRTGRPIITMMSALRPLARPRPCGRCAARRGGRSCRPPVLRPGAFAGRRFQPVRSLVHRALSRGTAVESAISPSRRKTTRSAQAA